MYLGSRRLVKGHQMQPGNVLGPRSKSLPGPWTTSLCLKGVESSYSITFFGGIFYSRGNPRSFDMIPNFVIVYGNEVYRNW